MGSPFSLTIIRELVDLGATYESALIYLSFCHSHIAEEGVVERHHILPKKVCPKYKSKSENLVSLKLADHLRSHYLLALALPENLKVVYAFHMMMSMKGIQKLKDGGYSEKEISEAAILYESNKLKTISDKRELMTRNQQDPGFKIKSIAAASECGKKFMANPELKALMKERYNDPEVTQRRKAASKEGNSRPEVIAIKIRICRERNAVMNSTPEHREHARRQYQESPSRLTHIRWHLNRDIVNPDCPLCFEKVA